MSRAAKSVFLFGLYIGCLGASLILAPNFMLRLIGAAPTTEVWIRVLGVVALILGGYYVEAARQGLEPFFRATVWGRTAGMLLFVLFALLRIGPPSLALFGAADGLGALWTGLALRSSREV